jgi:pimeloyl-ACP methyl ester carboxylesterase
MGISCHQGICKTGNGFLEPIMAAIIKHANLGAPIQMKILGHSFGGALAFQTAYYLRKNFLQTYFPNNDESWLRIGLVAFGSACFFDKDDFGLAETVIGGNNCLVIQRPRDPALQYTRMMGFDNPGCHVFLDAATNGSSHDLDTYAAAIKAWTDPALLLFDQMAQSK